MQRSLRRMLLIVALCVLTTAGASPGGAQSVSELQAMSMKPHLQRLHSASVVCVGLGTEFEPRPFDSQSDPPPEFFGLLDADSLNLLPISECERQGYSRLHGQYDFPDERIVHKETGRIAIWIWASAPERGAEEVRIWTGAWQGMLAAYGQLCGYRIEDGHWVLVGCYRMWESDVP